MKMPNRRILTVPILFAGSILLLPACTSNAAPTSNAAVVPKAESTKVAATANRIFPRALWVWDATTITIPEQQKKLFDFCKEKGITTIYVSVGDIFSNRKREKSDPKHITAPVLGKFLRAAHERKLEVEALDGDPSFALKDKHAEVLERMKKAIEYNRAAAPEERLDGFQWDTEPYILPEYRKDAESKTAVLKQYLDSASELRDAVNASRVPLRIGYAIPAFFDGEPQAVEWKGVSKPVAFHLMDILNTMPSAYVAIMAYRDKALGSNGTIEISRGEIEYAAKTTPKVKVWIGQETLDVTGDPPSITFWQEGETVMEYALAQIEDAYKGNPVVGGFSIHHWVSYTNLKPGDPILEPVITEALTILTPKANASVARNTSVEGTARLADGKKVIVSVRPDGDVWYPQPETSVAEDGRWGVSCRFGNDQTPAGRIFDVRAQLLKDDGTVVTEQIVRVKTQ